MFFKVTCNGSPTYLNVNNIVRISAKGSKTVIFTDVPIAENEQNFIEVNENLDAVLKQIENLAED